jgi:predicted  nucleic acid-binding Zn-ribbon protein
MTLEGESLENQQTPVDRIVSLAREAWAQAKALGKTLAQKTRTGVEFLRLKRRARSLRSEMHSHSLLLAQLVVRLDRELGKESVFHPFSQIKSEIEAISRRQAKLERLAVEISDVRCELKRRHP